MVVVGCVDVVGAESAQCLIRSISILEQRSQASKQSNGSSQDQAWVQTQNRSRTIPTKPIPRAGARLTVRGAEGTTMDSLSRSCAKISELDLERLPVRPRGMVLVMVVVW